MNELVKVFSNEQFGQIRMMEINEKTYFAGKDIATALGYAKPRNTIATHCKGALKQGVLTPGGVQEVVFITEGDVYRLIAHSSLPSAEKFESWVFDDVLPSIRKHGMYMTDEAKSDPETALRNYLDETKEKLQKQADEIARLQGKLDSANKCLAAKGRELAAVQGQVKQYSADIAQIQKQLFLRDNRKVIFDFINKCVRSYAGVVYGGKIGLGWKDYYDTLTGVIGRDLRSTAKPYINHLADDEIAGALTVAWKTSVKDPASFFDGNITDLIRTIIREAA